MPPGPEDISPDSVEARALLVSTLVGAGCAALALGWGLLAGSRVIIFDGASATIGLLLSIVALLAARAAREPGSATFPYGRVSFVPAAVGIQGIARFAVSAYAVVDAALLIRDGGDTVSTGSVIVYSSVVGTVCTVQCAAVTRRGGPGACAHRRRARTPSPRRRTLLGPDSEP